MMNSKKKIDAMIREDLGISILKRFNIVFYRTFIWSSSSKLLNIFYD